MNEQNKTKHKWKTVDMVFVGIFAALIAVCAQIAIPMAIPFTLQTFAVCLAAGLLGAKRGTLAVTVYILIGMIGLPVFTGFKSGVAAVTGPTGGYIVGFIFSALIIGILSEKCSNKFYLMVIYMFIGLLSCYVFGTVWFMVAYHVNLTSALTTCVVPFIVPEIIKILLAAFLSAKLRPHLNKYIK